MKDEDKTKEQLIEELQTLEYMAEGVGLTDIEGVFLYTNPRFEKMFGYNPDELIGKPAYLLNAPSNVNPEDMNKIIMDSMKEKGEWVGEVHSVKKDGTLFWTRAKLTEFEHSKFGIVWLGIQEDITERKQSEDKVKKNEKRYQSLVETIPHGIQENDTNGIITFSNEAHCKMHGYAKGELVGKSIWDMVDSKQEKNKLREYLAFLVKEQPAPTSYIAKDLTKDGQLIDVQVDWTYKRDEQEHLTGFISVITDITERNQAEETSRFHSQILANMNEGVSLVRTNDGAIVYMNPKFEKMFGYANNELVGEHVSIINASTEKTPEETAHEIIKSLNEIGSWSGEVCNIKKDGTVFWCQVNVSPFEHSQYGTVWLSVHEDISERKLLENQLRQALKMEAIGVLTGGIAHEFNNLLSPILGYTEMLMSDKSENDSDLNKLEQIQIAGNRAKDLVLQMLAYGRKSISQRKFVKLETLVEETIKLIQNTISPNISINKEIKVDLPPIIGMPHEIHQVLLNLCINATQAMPDGGELTISLKMEGSHKFINLEGQKREGNFIGLSVQDTGAGIDPATLDHIFDPFFTTKDVGEGSGLGLSVVLGIVEQHQGHIEVDSKVGKGSTFHIFFPVAQEEVKPSVVKTKTLSQGNERILLIDEEPMITNLTKIMLEKLGYKVTEFLDCDEALKLFAEHPQDFDLVITDYEMLKMNGKQLAEKLKEIYPEIPIILYTGYSNLIAKEEIHTWGMDDLLIKPTKLKEFSETVRGVLDRRSAEA